MARPSFHITARRACIVQRVKNRLKSLAENKIFHSTPGRQGSNRIKAQRHCAFDDIDTSLSGARLRYPRGAAPRTHSPTSDGIPGLIGILDSHVSNQEASLLTTACENRLFLKHDHLQSWGDKSEAELKSIADVATALLIGLPNGSALHNIDHAFSLDSAIDNESFYANLVHLILSIKKVAMDALVRIFLEAIQVNLLRWYQFWLHKHSIVDWFAEWPNGQRPLSTTWPWNIKPALLVLWGVCWMFYYDNEGRWCADNFGGAGNSAPNIMHGQGAQAATISQPEPAPNLLPWRAPATYPNYSWLQANAFDSRRASHGDSHIGTRSHLTSVPAFLDLDQPAAGTDPFVSPAFTSASANSYISAAPAALSNPFAGPSSGIWPVTSGINTENAPVYDTGRSLYQVPTTPVGSLDSIAQHIGSVHSWPPYVVPKSTPNPAGRGGTPNHSRAVIPSQQRRNMQDYPSPQMSDISGQMDPSYPAYQSRIMTSPSRTLIKSPSISGFSTETQSIDHEREPLRNAAGSYYCSHPACADKPPVFPRKCEWTKHMDKHTRPYICDEPGCENIRGFTYSGGLHRHQKEVHRQHGGPRSACLCPYKDCKRSTGLGFSRKENLAEHIRRVHRDAGQNQAPPADAFPDALDAPAVPGNRKRKRRAAENEGDEIYGSQDGQDAQGLKQEIKKLKKELLAKDERLQRLEEQVRELLARNYQA